jgi:hypothetical protein
MSDLSQQETNETRAATGTAAERLSVEEGEKNGERTKSTAAAQDLGHWTDCPLALSLLVPGTGPIFPTEACGCSHLFIHRER